MSLITKYRPSTFNAVAGNAETVRGVQTLLDREKDQKHTFLISGPRGCGKTTLGRIIAQHVGCDMKRDFTEVDTAALNGVGPARELRGNCVFKGMAGGKRVWLLDECHRMSSAAQDVLLKTFEEPPEHAYFILATTDPQRLLPTVIDRLAHFKVEPLSPKESIAFIKKIIRREKKQIPIEILETLVEKAEYRPRSSLNLLEKIINETPERMEEILEKEQVAEAQTIELVRAIIRREKWSKIARLIKELLEKESAEDIRRMVLGYATSILLKEDDMSAFEIAENFQKPFYVNGKADLIIAAYNSLLEEG